LRQDRVCFEEKEKASLVQGGTGGEKGNKWDGAVSLQKGGGAYQD